MSSISQLAQQPLTNPQQISTAEIEQFLNAFAANISQHAPKALATLAYANNTLQDILGPALELLGPVIEFVKEHPWVLIPILIPALEMWLVYLGLEAGGITAHSIAALIQSYIASISKGSILTFLTSNGAGGFANRAMAMAGMSLVCAVVLAAVGQVLLFGTDNGGVLFGMDNGNYSADVATALEIAWNHSTGQDQGGSSGAGHTMPFAAVGWVCVAVVCAWFQL